MRSVAKQLITYIISHPSVAQALREALLSGESGESGRAEEEKTVQSVWVSATEAGRMIGKSDDWIKTHRQLFPHTRYEERGKKGKWWFDGTEIQGCYDTFLRLNTTAT